MSGKLGQPDDEGILIANGPCVGVEDCLLPLEQRPDFEIPVVGKKVFDVLRRHQPGLHFQLPQAAGQDLRRTRQRILGGGHDVRRSGKKQHLRKNGSQRFVNAGVAADQRQGPQIFRRLKPEAQNPTRVQFRGALTEKFPRVEAVRLARCRLRHADEDEVIRAALPKIPARVGEYNADIGLFERLSNPAGKMRRHQVQHDRIQFDVIDSPRPVLPDFPDNPLHAAPEDQHVFRIRVLQRCQVAEVLGLGSLRLECQGIVFKNGDLPVKPRDGDSSVGGVPAVQKIRVIPSGHLTIRDRCLPQERREDAGQDNSRPPEA